MADFATKIEQLKHDLQKALMVELTTIPPYLCALYSIREGTNREAASVLHSVVMEEMLHMALVANLLNAVGGEPQLTQSEDFPSYPATLLGQEFEIDLARFSKKSIETFMEIERPATSKPQLGMTIGEFYDQVRLQLKDLCETHEDSEVFSGDPRRQITTEYYYGGAGSVFPIRCRESAECAIQEIVDQGEGAPKSIFEEDYEVRPTGRRPVHMTATADTNGPAGAVAGSTLGAFRHTQFSGEVEPAHYYRFMEIQEGRYFQAGDTANSGPSGPEFPVQWDAVYPMQENPDVANAPEGSPIRQLMDDFNRGYMRLLDRLEQGFQGNPSVLVHIAGDMYELKERALELMRIPTGDGTTTVGPTFQRVERPYTLPRAEGEPARKAAGAKAPAQRVHE